MQGNIPLWKNLNIPSKANYHLAFIVVSTVEIININNLVVSFQVPF